MSTPLPDLPVGGRIKQFIHVWRNLPANASILDMVCGMSLDLTDFPKQLKLPYKIKMLLQETLAGQ